MRIGLIEQDSASGRYDLGSYALDLRLAGLGRLDPVRLAGPILDNLCKEMRETVALGVWGNRGATIVRYRRCRWADYHHAARRHRPLAMQIGHRAGFRRLLPLALPEADAR